MSERFYNRTRQSRSIPQALLRRGRLLEIPLYYALRQSDLAREGIERSGSHRFADHIYRNQPSGHGAFGRWLDRTLLGLPAARSFRSRYLAAREEVAAFVLDRLRQPGDTPIRVVSVPCGIPRELVDAADEVRGRHGELPARVEFYGIDLDVEVLAQARRFARERGLDRFRARHGDAFSRSSYPEPVACITCTGLAEFLDDDELTRLYHLCFEVLESGGLMITSGMRRRWLSDYLLRLGEVKTHYRGPEDLSRLARRVPFRDVHVRVDDVGLQAILTARA